jgi:hypothetical protein
MTRRGFLVRLLGIGAALCAGGRVLARARRASQALSVGQAGPYPGKVIPIWNVETQGKWLG